MRIREIEFIVQSLQMLHGGRNPFLQGAQTLPMLDKLAQYRLLEGSEALALTLERARGDLRRAPGEATPGP